MKLMKKAAVNKIPSLSIFGRNRTLSEHVAHLRFGKKNWKSVY